MPNRCAAASAISSITPSSWNGWGADSANTRFQPAAAAQLRVEDVPGLKLKWAFGFPGARAVSGQPAVVAGRVFVSSDNGYVYALDSATGCLHWSIHAEAAVRSSVTVERIGAGILAYVRTIPLGSLTGNTVDAFLGRFRSHGHTERRTSRSRRLRDESAPP